MTVPDTPTAKHTLVEGQLIACSSLLPAAVVAAAWTAQVAPPSALVRTSPTSPRCHPDPKHVVALGHEIPLKKSLTAACLVQPVPPLVVATMVP